MKPSKWDIRYDVEIALLLLNTVGDNIRLIIELQYCSNGFVKSLKRKGNKANSS